MSCKSNDAYEIIIARVLTDAGADVVARGHNGSGHRKITFQLHGQQRTYHYPNSGHLRGSGPLNCKASLMALIRSIVVPLLTNSEQREQA